jgi:hypothetical protein
MKKMMLVAVAFLVLGAVIGVIVLLGSEEKVVPQAKVAKVTITCELGRSEFDIDCDGIADTADSDPTVANPDQGVAECQTWRDCESGFACRRGQCEEARIVLTCDVGHNEFDIDCDGVGNSVDNGPTVPNPGQAVVRIQCVLGHNGFDDDCDMVANDIDACPETVGTAAKSGCP